MFLLATENPGSSRERRLSIPLAPSAPPQRPDAPLCVEESARFRLELNLRGISFKQASLYLGTPEEGTCLANAYRNGPMYDPEDRLRQISADYLFVGHIDVIKLTLLLKLDDGSSVVYYAPDIFCVFANESEEYNVLAIVESLLSFEDDADLCGLLNRRYTGHSGVCSFKPLGEYIRLFSDLRATFLRHETFFRRRAASAPSAAQGPGGFSRALSAEDVRWLTTHPEAFSPAPDGQGLRFGGLCLVPTALPPRAVRQDSLHEDRLILGFLVSIISAARSILSAGLLKVQASRDFLQTLPPRAHQLHMPIITIRSTAIERHSADLNRLGDIIHDLEAILRRYRETLHCIPLPLRAAPAPSHVMMSGPVYREFYALMLTWFERGELRLSGMELTHDVRDLPKLFEYYCLQRLLQLFLKKGFTLTENGVYTYAYPSPNSSYVREEAVANTYRFIRRDTRLTLYYEPVIYGFLPTDRAEQTLPNGLTLFRCNSGGARQSFWEPDFVIKVERRGAVDYAIFDAKYSFTISGKYAGFGKAGLLQEVISKYYLDTCAFSGHTTRMVWTLQGRTHAKFIHEQQTDLLRHFTPDHTFGNCPVSASPRIDELHRLWREMERIIPSLAPF